VTVVFPGGALASLYGPISVTLVNHNPCVIEPCCSEMLTTHTVLPFIAAYRSPEMSKPALLPSWIST
jgi:hypothetical protein